MSLQEINPATAALIARDLRARYPYQFLHPDADGGMGVLSRLPARDTGLRIGGTWLGTPIVVDVTVGTAHTLVAGVHAVSTIFRPSMIETEVRRRAEDARALVAFARRQGGTPLIVTTDFNSTDQNNPYGIVTSALVDSWREAGWGLGNTFPGADSPGSGRFTVLGQLVPMWLVRIDYVFHTRQWRAVSASIGPWDGVSDHRPVLVRLSLQ